MNELATQCANDTYLSADRDLAQKEIDQLISEMNRIANDTEFNEMKLLNGTCSNKNLQVGAKSGQTIAFSINSMKASALSVGSFSVTSHTNAASGMSKAQA